MRRIRHFIGEVRTVVPLGAGLDNVAFLVNDEYVVRRSLEPDPTVTRREIALLDVVRPYAPLPVPEAVFAEPESGLLAYRVLPGKPLLNVTDADTASLGTRLGLFLAAIHAIPIAGIEAYTPRDDEPLQAWLDEARSAYPRVAEYIPVPVCHRIESWLSEAPPREPARLTFCHNDFGAEHILVDESTMRITGIIDWSDAAITDPLRDLALILRDLGPDALERALASYGTPPAPGDQERLLFYARCKILEDIAWGVETGARPYLDAGLAHLSWLFE